MDSTKRIRNGEKARGTFSTAEMERRQGAPRRHMAAFDIDAALLTSMHNIRYQSDFLCCDFGRPYGLIVTQDKAVTISANIDHGQPWRRTFGDNQVYTDWWRDNYHEAVRSEAPAAGRIGVELDHLSLEAQAKLRHALPDAELIDIAGATMTMRTIKSPEEIALIKDGARIADIGGAACVEALGEGVPEYVVALHATDAMVREIAAAHPQSEIRDTLT